MSRAGAPDAAAMRALAAQAMEAVLAAGADEADLRLQARRELTVTVRSQEVELLKDAWQQSLELRVYRDGRQATLRATRLSAATLPALAREVLDLAARSEADPLHRLPEPALYAQASADLDLADAGPPLALESAIALAREAENAALAADSRIFGSQGASCLSEGSRLLYLTSNGFEGERRSTAYALTVIPVARDSEGKLATEHWARRARHREDLADPAGLGREAAMRVVERLDPRRAPTGRFPVILEPRLAARFLGRIFACLSGSAVWRRQSYLADRLETPIASAAFSLRDDPLRRRGLGSRDFDGEGLPCRPREFVQAGKLLCFPTDLESARRLDLPPTGHGVWGGGVSASNLYVEPGAGDLGTLVAGTPRGLLVTDVLGGGFNTTSGHWSQGCSGQWIEDGALAFPVSQVTIAGHMDEVLGGLDAVGADMDFSFGTMASPSLRLGAMTVSGS